MSAHSFTTMAQAVRYVRAMGRSSIYTAGGNPPLPRCEHPYWLYETPEERRAAISKRGRITPCSCTSRTDVSTDCPHVTRQHTEILELDGAFVVDADPREPAVAGETVTVDGESVRLNRVPARAALTDNDYTNARQRWPREETTETHAARVAGPREPRRRRR